MDYTGHLFIDMADLEDDDAPQNGRAGEAWRAAFPGCWVKGTRRPFEGDWAKVTHISVAHTPVGPTILDRCPRLRWVLVRGHATNCVDIGACKQRGVGVASAGAFEENCAAYIEQYLAGPPYLLFGYGRIARRLAAGKIAGERAYIIDSKTPVSKTSNYVMAATTIIGTVPPPRLPRPPVFGRWFFSCCCAATFISICHEPLMDNAELLAAIKDGRVVKAVIDTLADKCKEELLATGKVVYTADTAWKTNFRQLEYIGKIKAAIKEMEGGKSPCIIVPRKAARN